MFCSSEITKIEIISMLKNNGFLWQTKFSKIYYQFFLLNTKEFRKSEYIDFYNYGFEKRSLYNAGFYEVSNYKKQLIIPDLFGPFIKKNNDVFFFTNKKTTKNIQIFRADGDQDMPVNK